MSNLIKVLIILCLLLFPVFLISQTAEAWIKYERDGFGFGYDHIEVERLSNGNLKYTIYQKIKTDLAGTKQEIVQTGHYIVDNFFRPVSLKMEIISPYKKVKMEGVCRNGILSLTTLNERNQRQLYEIPFEYVYFDVVMGKIISWKRFEVQFNLKVFNPFELKVNNYLVRIKSAAQNGIIASVKERITMNMFIDEKGKVKGIQFEELKTNAKLTSANVARDIDYLPTDNSLTMTLKGQPTIPNVYTVNTATVQVSWENIPFEDFKFEDNRQKVVTNNNEAATFTTVLEFNTPSFPEKMKLSKKLDDSLSPYLKDTEYIIPSSALIKEQLLEIKGRESDASQLVHDILLWVFGNVKSTHIVDNLTGPEVLERRIGKCTEYTSLFASLSRAAGIPTKVVFGEVQNGDIWMGHMWCEVWLGEWMAVDPSAGVFVRSPSHLKLFESKDLGKILKMRWQLADNLSIKILSYNHRF